MARSEQIGSGAPFDILGYVRKLIPFWHLPYRSGQKSGPGQWLTATFSAPDSNTNFKISLGKIPTGYIVINASAGGVVYVQPGIQPFWTPTLITLRASAVGTYELWVF